MSMAVAGTWSFRTTSARRPSPSRSPAAPSFATGSTWAWSGLDGTKMSKSLGNLVFVGELLEDWQPVDIRTALLAHHYRQDWDWNERRHAQRGGAASSRGGRQPAIRDHQCAAGDTDPALEAVRRALDDDLDTPAALAALDELADGGQPVDRGAELLGITL